jgi:hypothetical protein
MSLSERLRQQELLDEAQNDVQQQASFSNNYNGNYQQTTTTARRGMPMMDSDHSIMTSGSVSKKKLPKFLSTGGANPSGSLHHRSELPIPSQSSSTQRSITKRTVGVVLNVLGECNFKKRDQGVDNQCDGDLERKALLCSANATDTDNPQQPPTEGKSRLLTLTMGLLFIGVFAIGRRRGHQTTTQVEGLSMSAALYSPEEEQSSSLTDGKSSSLIRGGQYASDTMSNPMNIVHQAVFPPHLSNLANLTAPYNPQTESPYFWDVHLSGESVAEAIFAQCHGLVMACEFGLRQPNYNEDVSEVVCC